MTSLPIHQVRVLQLRVDDNANEAYSRCEVVNGNLKVSLIELKACISSSIIHAASTYLPLRIQKVYCNRNTCIQCTKCHDCPLAADRVIGRIEVDAQSKSRISNCLPMRSYCSCHSIVARIQYSYALCQAVHIQMSRQLSASSTRPLNSMSRA